MLKKYFTFTIIIAFFSYFCINSPNFVYFAELVYIKSVQNLIDISTYLRESYEGEKSKRFRIFTADELKEYDGEHLGGKVYLAILGTVFDVTKGSQHYGSGGTYHGFAGQDASRAFITGDFTEKGLHDDISDFDDAQLLSLIDWLKMYTSKYDYKGKLIGTFYDENGERTPYLLGIEEKMSQALLSKKYEEKDKDLFPPCNSEFIYGIGSRVWCSKKSGGVKRDWVGVPRIYRKPGSKTERCACVNEDSLGRLLEESNFKVYPNCNPKSETCSLEEPVES